MSNVECYEKYKKNKNERTNWEELKNFLHWYEEQHGFPRTDGKSGRYCLALSVEDILTVMENIEKDNSDNK